MPETGVMEYFTVCPQTPKTGPVIAEGRAGNAVKINLHLTGVAIPQAPTAVTHRFPLTVKFPNANSIVLVADDPVVLFGKVHE